MAYSIRRPTSDQETGGWSSFVVDVFKRVETRELLLLLRLFLSFCGMFCRCFMADLSRHYMNPEMNRKHRQSIFQLNRYMMIRF